MEHIREAYRACYSQCHAIRDQNQAATLQIIERLGRHGVARSAPIGKKAAED